MAENVEEAFKKYRTCLTRNKLKAGVAYDADFQLKSFTRTISVKKITFLLTVDSNDSTPTLTAECISGDDIGTVDFAAAELIKDRYNKAAVRSDTDFSSPNTYDISLFRKFLDKTNIKR